MDGIENPNTTFSRWLDDMAAAIPSRDGDRTGTLRHIDVEARRRAVQSIIDNETYSLSRPIELGAREGALYGSISIDGSTFSYGSVRPEAPIEVTSVIAGVDTSKIDAHGHQQTHIDALNHLGRHGSWYGGHSVDDEAAPSLIDLAKTPIVTRAVVADVPAARGTDWVDPSEPVTGDDINRALAASKVNFEPGDALLLYMGRDRYEAQGNTVRAGDGSVPGAGWDVSRWIVEHQVSVLCWDLQDAVCATEPFLAVHLLIWAIGQIIVDNCHLADVARSNRASGMLVIALPPLPGATGFLVNPVIVT